MYLRKQLGYNKITYILSRVSIQYYSHVRKDIFIKWYKDKQPLFLFMRTFLHDRGLLRQMTKKIKILVGGMKYNILNEGNSELVH